MKKVSYRKPAPRTKRTKTLRAKVQRKAALREEALIYICPVRPSSPLKVAEMFAGVGGFRVGLERANKEARKELFDVVWGNQFEPSTTRQHAFEVYRSQWSDKGVHSNQDINLVKI